MLQKLCTAPLNSLFSVRICHLCDTYIKEDDLFNYGICEPCMRAIPRYKASETSCIFCNKNETTTNKICSRCTNLFGLKCNVRVHSIFTYKDNTKKLIFRGKYLQDVQSTDFLYFQLLEYITYYIQRDSVVDFITSIPSTKTSLTKRGFNYMFYIGYRISTKLNIPMLEFLDTYRAYTDSEKKDPLIRLSNLEPFRYILKTPQESIKNKTVLLFDDVLTTGNSCRSAVHTLQKYGVAHVIIVTLTISPQFNKYMKIIINNFELKESRDRIAKL